MEDTPKSLGELRACEDALWTAVEPLRDKRNASTSKTERKALKEVMLPLVEELRKVTDIIHELEQNANTLKALLAREDALWTRLEPLRHQRNASVSQDERISLQLQMMPIVKQLWQLQADIKDEVEKLEKKPSASTCAASDPPAGSVFNSPPKTPVEDLAKTVEDDFVEFPAKPTDRKPALYPISGVEPKKPPKNPPQNQSVLRFEAGGQVYCFGHIDKPTSHETVTVSQSIKVLPGDVPVLLVRVSFPRDKIHPGIRFHDPKSHTVYYRFRPGFYTVDDHLVTDETEFQEFLVDAPQHVRGKAKEAKTQAMLYRVTLSNPEIQSIFDAMKLIPGCKTLSLFSWAHRNVAEQMQYLYTHQMEYKSPLDPYLHKHQKGLAAYVQWGKIIIPDNETILPKRQFFDGYSDFNLIIANAAAREALLEVNIINKIRSNRVKMTVTQAGPDNDYYIAFIQFPDFGEAKKVITNARTGLVTWDPPPTVKPQHELATGERPEKDNPWGWEATIQTDTVIEHGADIMVLLKRPTDAANKYMDKEMPAPNKKGDVLRSQMVYYKIQPQATVIKGLLKSMDELRFKGTKGDHVAEMKRGILCGRDQTIHRLVDLLEGLTEDEIATLLRDLTPSQASFIRHYCRSILNGIGILQGPAGSGKTTIIKILVRIAEKRGLKVAILTEANSTADNAVQVVEDPAFVAVRVHSLGLERHHMMKESRKGIAKDSLKPADPEPNGEGDADDDDDKDRFVVPSLETNEDSSGQEVEEDSSHLPNEPPLPDRIEIAHNEALNAEGWKHDDISIKFNDVLIKTAQDRYGKASQYMHPEDPRMKMIRSALWTWMSKVLGFIKMDKESPEVKRSLEQLRKMKEWQELRDIMVKAKGQELNSTERTQYGNLIEACGSSFVKDAARAVICTVAQFANEWSQDTTFDLFIIDEGTTITDAQFTQIWRGDATVIFIGDHAQLWNVTQSKPKDNPFVSQYAFPPYVRFIESGWPYARLVEVMRMTNGLELICSELFYEGQLVPGTSTSLSHESRKMSRTWHEKISERYPSLKQEPEGSVYPVFFNIPSASVQEKFGGTSRVNLYNVSAVVDHIIWVVESGIAMPYQIGIVTPYAGQVSLYQETFVNIRKTDPSIRMDQVQIGTTDMWVRAVTAGTTEWWCGKQAEYMIVDLVRAKNDQGILGFMPDKRRLNVLLSRQQHALVIFGDQDCTKIQTADVDEIKRRDSDNRLLMRTFQWLERKGRRVNVSTDELSQQYVKLSKIPEDDTEDEAKASGASVWDSPYATKLDPIAATGESTTWDSIGATGDERQWSAAATWGWGETTKKKRNGEGDEGKW